MTWGDEWGEDQVGSEVLAGGARAGATRASRAGPARAAARRRRTRQRRSTARSRARCPRRDEPTAPSAREYGTPGGRQPWPPAARLAGVHRVRARLAREIRSIDVERPRAALTRLQHGGSARISGESVSPGDNTWGEKSSLRGWSRRPEMRHVFVGFQRSGEAPAGPCAAATRSGRCSRSNADGT